MPDVLSPSVPGSLTGANLTLVHLSFFYAQLQAPLPAEDADAEKLLALILLYSLRASTGVHPPPPSYSHFVAALEEVINVELGKESLPETRKILSRHLEEHARRIIEPASGLRELAMGIDSIIITDNEEVAVLRGIHRRSPLGILLRRVRLNIWKMDDLGLKACAEAFGRWFEAGEASSSSLLKRRERGQGNDRLQSYLIYQHALKTGDYSLALKHRFRFFDFFPRGSTKVLYQRTLLDLAHFHYQTKGLASAKAALKEAIHIARSAEDRECIMACDSLMRRLQYEESKAVSTDSTNRGGNDSSFDARSASHTSRIPGSNEWSNDRLVDALQALETGVPLDVVLWALVRPPKRPEALEVLEGISNRAHRRDVVIARLWSAMGYDDVAQVHRHMAVEGSAFPDQPNREEVLLEARMQGAEAKALAGEYERGLALLIDAEVVRALSVPLHARWHRAVLSVLWVRARRRADHQTLRRLRELDTELEGALEGSEDDEDWGVVGERAERLEQGREGDAERHRAGGGWKSERTKWLGLRRKAKRLLDANEPVRALDPLTHLLSRTTERRHADLRLDALVLLSEATLLGPRMPKHALEMLDEAMPELLADVDVERRGLARYAYARAVLGVRRERAEERRQKGLEVVDKQDAEDAEHALSWLEEAETDLRQTASLPALSRVLWYRSRLSSELHDVQGREAASERFVGVQGEIKAQELRAGVDELTERMERVLRRVGERVSVGF